MAKVSNYEKVYVHFQKLFLEMDHKKAAKKLCLACDDENIYIPFFNQPIVLNRGNAEMTSSVYPSIPVVTRLLVLHHLYYHKEDAYNSSNMVPFRDLRECAIFEDACYRNTILPFAEAFAGKTELLRERASQIGCVFLSFGDVSFTINAFPLIPLQFIFWDGDEEFPAKANILFDQNIAQFIHAESIPVLADFGVSLLTGKHRIELV
jgi:hypothetical protein